MKLKLLYLSILFISIIFILYNECNCNYIEKFNIGCDIDDGLKEYLIERNITDETLYEVLSIIGITTLFDFSGIDEDDFLESIDKTSTKPVDIAYRYFISNQDILLKAVRDYNIDDSLSDESSDEELTRGSKRTKSTDESTDDLRTIMEDFEIEKKYERKDLQKHLEHNLNIYLTRKQKSPEERKKIYNKLKNISNNELAILIIQLKYSIGTDSQGNPKTRYTKILDDKLKKYL